MEYVVFRLERTLVFFLPSLLCFLNIFFAQLGGNEKESSPSHTETTLLLEATPTWS